MRKKKTIFIVLITVLAVTISLLVVNRNKKPNSTKKLYYHTYQTESGWGYRIFTADSVLLIQQDMIPGLPGTDGFETETKAKIAAGFVVEKIKKGIFPPTVSMEELDSLDVLPQKR